MKNQLTHKELLIRQKYRDMADERIDQKHMREEMAQKERELANLLSKQ